MTIKWFLDSQDVVLFLMTLETTFIASWVITTDILFGPMRPVIFQGSEENINRIMNVLTPDLMEKVLYTPCLLYTSDAADE